MEFLLNLAVPFAGLLTGKPVDWTENGLRLLQYLSPLRLFWIIVSARSAEEF